MEILSGIFNFLAILMFIGGFYSWYLEHQDSKKGIECPYTHATGFWMLIALGGISADFARWLGA